MKKLTAIILVPLCLLCVAGCNTQEIIDESEIVGKVYTYEKDGFGGDFQISVMENGTFSYYEGLLSNYIGCGTWKSNDTILHLSDNGMETDIKNYYFQVDDNDLVFIADDSDDFLFIDVSDGERFLSSQKAE